MCGVALTFLNSYEIVPIDLTTPIVAQQLPYCKQSQTPYSVSLNCPYDINKKMSVVVSISSSSNSAKNTINNQKILSHELVLSKRLLKSHSLIGPIYTVQMLHQNIAQYNVSSIPSIIDTLPYLNRTLRKQRPATDFNKVSGSIIPTPPFTANIK